jgi:hypothetical protein
MIAQLTEPIRELRRFQYNVHTQTVPHGIQMSSPLVLPGMGLELSKGLSITN